MWKTVIILTILVALWVTIVRPYLRHKPWMQWFFTNPVIEWIEIHIYRKSESIAWARYLAGLGTFLTAIASIDPSVVAIFEPLLPEDKKWVARVVPMVITVAGLMAEWMRRDTKKPLDVVALPSDAPLEVKEAVVRAEHATAVAVEVAKEKV